MSPFFRKLVSPGFCRLDHFLISSLLPIFLPVPVFGSPETIWEGSEAEVLEQALEAFTPTARSRITARFAIPKDGDPLNLERKLWMVIEFLIEDQGLNYSEWHFLSAFSTIGARFRDSEYSAEKAREVLNKCEEVLPEIDGLMPASGESDPVYVEKAFQGLVKTSPEQLRRERLSEFLANTVVGASNILQLSPHLQPADPAILSPFSESKDTNVANVGHVFAEIMTRKLKPGPHAETRGKE